MIILNNINELLNEIKKNSKILLINPSDKIINDFFNYTIPLQLYIMTDKPYENEDTFLELNKNIIKIEMKEDFNFFKNDFFDIIYINFLETNIELQNNFFSNCILKIKHRGIIIGNDYYGAFVFYFISTFFDRDVTYLTREDCPHFGMYILK